MGDNLKKVRTGDALKIPAQTFNAFIDAALDLRGRQQGTQRAILPGGRQAGIIPVRNDTGQDLERFSAVGIASPLIDPGDNVDEFKSRAMAGGVIPIVPDHRGRFAIYLEPVAYGAVAMACVSGVIPCQINVDEESHLRVDVEHGATVRFGPFNDLDSQAFSSIDFILGDDDSAERELGHAVSVVILTLQVRVLVHAHLHPRLALDLFV